jgi:hypothetical protein
VPSRRLLVLVAAAAATLCGCGSSAPQSQSSSVSVAAATPRRPPAHRHAKHHHRPPRGPRIGTTRHVDAGTTLLAVDIRRVIDPLRGSGASLPAGTHAVGVLVQVSNIGSGVYDSSATGDISVLPSSGSAPPTFAPNGECQTQLRDFDNYISAGEIRKGCVVFDVSNRAHVRAVRFSPHAKEAGRVTWTVRR